jgi:hypothetical protein
MNGFFMQMRSKFVEENCSLHFYVVSWDSNKLAWEDFRGKVRTLINWLGKTSEER